MIHRTMLLLPIFAAFWVSQPTAAADDPPTDQEVWASLKQKIVLPNGERLAYVDLGDRTLPPLVLLHGFTDNSRSWSLVAPYLVEKHRLIAIDLRGHGRSDAPQCCYGLVDLAYDLRLLLDALNIAKPDIAGHSLGSMVAQSFAQAYPERVNRLVLISSTLSAAKIAGPGSWLWTNIHKLTSPIDPDSQFMLDWYANPHPVDPDFLTRERHESAAVPPRVWRRIDEEMAKADLGASPFLIQSPVLIIWGKEDKLFGADDQAALRKKLPQAKFVAISAGHNVLWEQPGKVAETIDAFLRP